MKTALFVAGALGFAAASMPATAANVLDWRWLEGTTWYVPTSGLPAYVYIPAVNQLVPIQDQTVYTITGYRNGYFWGRTTTSVNGVSSCKSLVGSVTPEGRVYLTFTTYPFDGSASTVGIGMMVFKAGQWTMINQMSTGSASAQVGHWAYMVRTSSGSDSWQSLPGVETSVEDFTAPCMDAAPATSG